MKPKHTKGPWKYTEDTEDLLAGREVVAMNIYAPDKLCGHVASVGALGMAANEIEANARLISTAPEMLEALETLRNEILSQGESGDQVNLRMLESVIAKARGAKFS